MEILRYLLLFIVLLFPSIHVRAASFYMDGTCISSTTDMIEKFESKYPILDGAAGTGGILSFIVYPTTLTAAGVLTSRIDRLNLATGAVVNGFVFSTQLMDCSAANKLGMVATGSVQYMMIILALVFLFVFGFFVGKNLSPPKFYGSD